MAYYFMVETKRGKYTALDIHQSKEFQVEPKFKKAGACTLLEIDLFTTSFIDEESLRIKLIEEGILSPKFANKPLSIRNAKQGRYSKVPYDFLYQKDIEYIEDYNKLIERILDKYYANNFGFIRKLANNFNGHNECSSTAPEVRQLIDISIRSGFRDRRLDDLDENGDILVERLLKLLILKYTQHPYDGKIQYTEEINYRNLHDLIAFTNYCDEETKKLTPTEQIKKEEPKVLKRTKKIRQEIEGQLSFWDI